MGWGCDPIGADVRLKGRWHEDRAVLGTDRPQDAATTPVLQPSLSEWAPRTPHLLLIALQQGNEDTGDSAGCGIYLRGRCAQSQAMPGPGVDEGRGEGGGQAGGGAWASLCGQSTAPRPRSGT